MLLLNIKYFDNIICKLYEVYPNIHDSFITYQMLRISISNMINDIYSYSKITIKELNSIDEIKNYNKFVISMSNEMKNNCDSIREFLFQNVCSQTNSG